MSDTKNVLLIHGAWLTPTGWDWFIERYTKMGYKVTAPPWPYEDVPLEELRKNPSPELRNLSIAKIVDHYEEIIRKMDEPPIIIGHSTGGLVAQLLLDRGLGVAGVALDPIPMRGVPVTLRVLKSSMPVLTTWGFWNKVMTMSYESFATTFAQTLPENEKRAAYERYIAPTPGLIYLTGAFGIGAGIHTGNPKRAPLLMAVGSEDVTMDPPVVRAAYNKQKKSPSVTEFKEFKGRSHFLIHEPGWEEVADYAINWARNHQKAPEALQPN